jgi:hypothetical protein
MRQFNVYSALVVPIPNEIFEWVAGENEGTVVVSPVPDTTWPLTSSSYTVPGGGGFPATANGVAGAEGTFVCDPVAPDVTTQTIVIASQGFISFCSDVNVNAGDYFVWENTTSSPIVVAPDPDNPNWWPLEADEHTVPPNGYLTVLVPEEAEDGNYPLSVTIEGAGTACPDLANQPVIKVGSNK